jgi:hypothetical protein
MWGRNCEYIKQEEKCPLGWFGRFNECRKCECRLDRGFQQQCDQNGQCKCRDGMYFKVGSLDDLKKHEMFFYFEAKFDIV